MINERLRTPWLDNIMHHEPHQRKIVRPTSLNKCEFGGIITFSSIHKIFFAKIKNQFFFIHSKDMLVPVVTKHL